MSEILKRKEGEDKLDYIKRIVYGKLKDHTIDNDFTELAPLVFDKEYSSDVARRMFYGVRRILELLDDKEISALPKNKLDELKDIIGELDIKKQEAKSKTQELNKIKRNFIKSIEISNDIWEQMTKNGFKINIPDYCQEEINIYNDNKMIVNISDWHIGYIIHNCKGNKYNLEIARKRINLFTQEIEKYSRLYNINKIYVVNTGDTIEHTYMRGNQSQNTEFGQSQQINESIQLIYDFLVSLNSFSDVEYYSLAGNHDRSCGDKTQNNEGDNANVVISDQLFKWNKLANNKRLKIVNGNHLDSEIILEINGVKCKFIHGDEKIKDGKSLLQTEMSMDEEFYNAIFRGHWHNYSITSENRGRYIINTGCLSGFNNYSTRFGCASNANQTICIIGDNEIELIKGVDLQIN